jgi:hypothetical protein
MHNSTLKNCRLEGLLHAVMIGSDNTIVNSTFWFNNYAIDSEWGGWRNTIKNNMFIDNWITLSYSESGWYDTITENCFTTYRPEATLMEFFTTGSHYIYNNYITLRRLIYIQPDVVLYWNNTTTGNYWEDYAQACNDTDNNGICDEPLILDENNVDYFPLKTPTFECLCKRVYNCSSITDSGCYILMNNVESPIPSGYCFYIDAENVIFDCNNHFIRVREGEGGIFIEFPNSHITIKNCIFVDSFKGIWLQTSHNKIINCSFINDSYGIDRRYSGINNLIVNSTFANCSIDIHIYYSGGNDTIMNNCFFDYLSVASEPYPNYFYNNYFENSGLIYTNSLYPNFWNTTKGNYYKDYAQVCNDTDNNGICDEPLVFNENNIDYLPLKLSPFECFIPYIPPYMPFCGNGICESGEDYINCPQDCPPPPPPPTPPKPVCRICDYSQLNPKDATQSVFILLCLILNVIFCNPILASLFFLFILIFCSIIYLRKGGYV